MGHAATKPDKVISSHEPKMVDMAERSNKRLIMALL